MTVVLTQRAFQAHVPIVANVMSTKRYSVNSCVDLDAENRNLIYNAEKTKGYTTTGQKSRIPQRPTNGPETDRCKLRNRPVSFPIYHSTDSVPYFSLTSFAHPKGLQG